jgi:hypothetical protein
VGLKQQQLDATTWLASGADLAGEQSGEQHLAVVYDEQWLFADVLLDQVGQLCEGVMGDGSRPTSSSRD